MNLGIFFQPGESFRSMSKSGQDVRLIEIYLKPYLEHFEKIYVFSYANEKYVLPKNVYLITNPTRFHRVLYAFLLPLIQKKYIDDCDVIRGLGLASSLSSFLLKKPFVFNWAYDYFGFSQLDKKYHYLPLYFLLEKLAFIRAEKILIATKSKFKTLKGPKYVYLPNGVDMHIFKQKNNKTGLIYIGRLEPQKNLLFLIKALGFLPQKYRKITIVGSGSQKKQLINLAQQQSVDINLIPKLPNNKIPRLLSKHSIFVLPSLQEGVPKVLLEAMAMGLVPVITKFPTSLEVVEDGIDGFVVDYSIEEYSLKIKLLLEDFSLWKRLSTNSKKKIELNFNQDQLMKKEIEVLIDVI